MYESSLFRRQNRFCSSQLIESINSGEFVERATQSFDFTCDKQEKNALVSRFLYFTQAHSIISFSDFKGKTENWGNSNGIWSGECENSSAARMALWKREKVIPLCDMWCETWKINFSSVAMRLCGCWKGFSTSCKVIEYFPCAGTFVLWKVSIEKH